MKRVLLILSTGLVNAGVPNVIMKIVEKLSVSYRFDIIVIGEKSCYFDDLFTNYGGRIIRLPEFNHKRELFKYSFKFIIYTLEIFCFLRKNKYDIIHCHNGINASSSIIACILTKHKNIIIHSHGNYIPYVGKNLFLNIQHLASNHIIKNSKIRRVACSTNAGKSLFNSRDFINLRNPIDVEKYRKIHKIENINQINLVQIGYFCENKNQLFSLNILKNLVNQNCNVHLFFIGFVLDEEYLIKIKDFIFINKLSKNVTFLKHNYPKIKLFSKIDYLLQPSYSEGLPLTLLEAQVSNITCLASDTISAESNLGLCFYLPLIENDWIKKIMKLEKGELDEGKIKYIDETYYCNEIERIYDFK